MILQELNRNNDLGIIEVAENILCMTYLVDSIHKVKIIKCEAVKLKWILLRHLILFSAT